MDEDDFCMRNCELLSRRFLHKSQIYKHITHSSDNSIISVKLHFVQFGFLLRLGHRPIYKGGERKKTQVKGRTEKPKT